MSAETTAFVFPGQGPQDLAMFEEVRGCASFTEKYALLCEVLGEDPIREVERHGPARLHRNEVASLSTVLCSALELERLEARGIRCGLAAGYSVGQWSALYAAGVLSFEATLRLVFERAKLMNSSDATKDGAMLAVIGLGTDAVEAICETIAESGDFVAVSNYNCLGQLSLAGTRRGIERAREALTPLNPRKLVAVEVSGAWHCRLLSSAAALFEARLKEVPLSPPKFPIADNVTGDLLPDDRSDLVHTLAQHLCSPVRWESCVRQLASRGASRFIEVGFGDLLTKFGFFIDRKRQHLPAKRVA